MRRQSLWYISEADDDNQEGGGDAAATPNEDTGDTNDGGDSEGEEDDAGGDDDDNGNDEFDIDTSVDDDGGDEGDNDGENNDTDNSDSLGGGGDTTESMNDEEVNAANTALFSSLTAEEQQLKIRELKNLYAELYTSVNDILHRVDNMRVDEDNLDFVNRINVDIFSLKTMIADYFTYTFPTKSFVENDIRFNRFLYELKSITQVIDDYNSTKEKSKDKDKPKE